MMIPYFRNFVYIVLIMVGSVSAQQFLPEKPSDVLWKHKQRIITNLQKDISELHTLAQGQANFDALYYRLRLDIHYKPNYISGNVTARFRVLNEPTDTLRLDLDENMRVKDVSGAAKGYEHSGFTLTLFLNRSYHPGEIVTVTVDYSGLPDKGGFGYFTFSQMPDGSPQAWSLSEPYGAKFWWPCKDTPTDKADSVDILIGVPSGQLVASNGVLQDVLYLDSLTIFQWKERYPIATYLVSLAAGNYEHFQEYYRYGDSDSLLLDYYVYPGFLSKGKEAFRDMPDYLDALSHYFGPYPFLKEKYGQVQFGWGGGMEHQTMTSIGPVDESKWYLYVHELGHQWFGDAVTCASWQEIWLNEGFATYSEALYTEWAGFAGFPPGKEAYHAYMGNIRYTGERTVFVEDTSNVYDIFHRVVYYKGAWILHMLRHIMGDDNFFTALRQYVSDPRWVYGAVNTADFQSVCEDVSGLDLNAFFEQWLYYPYYPYYEYEWEIKNTSAGKTEVDFHLTQTQGRTIYEMPLDVSFTFLDGSDTTLTVQNYLREQSYTFYLNGIPLTAKLDKDDWVLKEATEKLPDNIPRTIRIKMYYPNPFNSRQTIITENWLYRRSKLQIYDLQGRLLRELIPQTHSRNLEFFEWDGRNNKGIQTASGIYIVRPVLETTPDKQIGRSVKVVYLR